MLFRRCIYTLWGADGLLQALVVFVLWRSVGSFTVNDQADSIQTVNDQADSTQTSTIKCVRGLEQTLGISIQHSSCLVVNRSTYIVFLCYARPSAVPPPPKLPPRAGPRERGPWRTLAVPAPHARSHPRHTPALPPKHSPLHTLPPPVPAPHRIYQPQHMPLLIARLVPCLQILP